MRGPTTSPETTVTERAESAARQDAASRRRRPGIGPVIWGSVALFAAMFALLTYQLSSSTPPAPRPVLVRKVLKRRVVTTVVPTPGRSAVTTSGQVAAAVPPSESAPVTTSAS
jgi:hypothetical protein